MKKNILYTFFVFFCFLGTILSNNDPELSPPLKKILKEEVILVEGFLSLTDFNKIYTDYVTDNLQGQFPRVKIDGSGLEFVPVDSIADGDGLFSFSNEGGVFAVNNATFNTGNTSILTAFSGGFGGDYSLYSGADFWVGALNDGLGFRFTNGAGNYGVIGLSDVFGEAELILERNGGSNHISQIYMPIGEVRLHATDVGNTNPIYLSLQGGNITIGDNTFGSTIYNLPYRSPAANGLASGVHLFGVNPDGTLAGAGGWFNIDSVGSEVTTGNGIINNAGTIELGNTLTGGGDGDLNRNTYINLNGNQYHIEDTTSSSEETVFYADDEQIIFGHNSAFTSGQHRVWWDKEGYNFITGRLLGGLASGLKGNHFGNISAGLNHGIDGDYNAVFGRSNSVTGNYNLIGGNQGVINGLSNIVAGNVIQIGNLTSNFNIVAGNNISSTGSGTFQGNIFTSVFRNVLNITGGSSNNMFSTNDAIIEGAVNRNMITASTYANVDTSALGARIRNSNNIIGSVRLGFPHDIDNSNYGLIIGQRLNIDNTELSLIVGNNIQNEANLVTILNGFSTSTVNTVAAPFTFDNTTDSRFIAGYLNGYDLYTKDDLTQGLHLDSNVLTANNYSFDIDQDTAGLVGNVLTLTADGQIKLQAGNIDTTTSFSLQNDQLVFGASDGSMDQMAGFEYNDKQLLFPQNNITIGTNAGNSLTGIETVAIGRDAANSYSATSPVTAVGTAAGRFSTGSANTYVGVNTGTGVTGNSNTFVGNAATHFTEAGIAEATAIGADARARTWGIAVGSESLNGGPASVSIGYRAGGVDGNRVAIGYETFYASTISNSIGIGSSVGREASGTENVGLGSFSLWRADAQNSFMLGNDAGRLSNLLNCVGIGHQSFNTSRDTNSIGIGAQSLTVSYTDNATGVGNNTLTRYTGKNGTALGYNAATELFSGNIALFDNTDIDYTNDYISNASIKQLITDEGLQHGDKVSLRWDALTGSAPAGFAENHYYDVINDSTFGAYQDLLSGNTGTYQFDAYATHYDNFVALGYEATPTKDNQVILGNDSIVEVKSRNYVFDVDQDTTSKTGYSLTKDTDGQIRLLPDGMTSMSAIAIDSVDTTLVAENTFVLYKTIAAAGNTVSLPEDVPYDGWVCHIIDGEGAASTKNITVDVDNAGETINGATTATINSDRQTYSIVGYVGIGYFIY